MADTDTTTVTPAPETKADEKPLSARERGLKVATEAWQRAATEESAADTTEKPAEATAAAPAPEPAAEAPETKAEEPFKPEQLSDRKFWDSLDKAGWAKAEKLHPVETARVKAAYVAAGRIAEEARQQAAQNRPAAPATEQPVDKKASPELREAIRKANSLDEDESAEGLQAIVKLTIPSALKEFGINTDEAKTVALEQMAYATVVAENPAIAEVDLKAMNDVVIAQPALANMLDIAATMPDEQRVAITANVIRIASGAVMAQQKAVSEAAAAKKAAETEKTRKTQATVRSNAANPANVVVESPSGGAPAGKPDWKKNVEQRWLAAAEKEGTA